MTTEAEIEAVAKAIRKSVGCWPECQEESTKLCNCHNFAAQAAIAALDAHRLARGLKTVAREPTEEMWERGYPWSGNDSAFEQNECWRAMWDAAPAAPEEQKP